MKLSQLISESAFEVAEPKDPLEYFHWCSLNSTMPYPEGKKKCKLVNGRWDFNGDYEFCPTLKISHPIGHVKGSFTVRSEGKHKALETLENGPTEVDLDFFINNLYLKNLEHGPKKVGGFYMAEHNLIDTIEFLPEEVGVLNLSHNKLTNLQGIHKKLKKCKRIRIGGNPIAKCVLGLMMIEGLEEIDATGVGHSELWEAGRIMNKHLGKGKQGILDAQNEMIENDLDDYAES